MFRFDWIRVLFSQATPPRSVRKPRKPSVRLQVEVLEDRTVPSALSLQTDDVLLHTDTQLSEPVIAFGSPLSENTLDDLYHDASARRTSKPASSPQQENNAPNNAALAGVGSGGGGNASSTPFTPGGGNSGGGGGGGGGANWNQLLNNSVNLASNASPTTLATTSIATALTAPAIGVSMPTAGGVNHSAFVSAATTGHGTGSGSTSPGAKLLPADGNTQSGQQIYNTAGTYTWIAPAGVTSVSIQEWGAGGGGGGGGGGATSGLAGGSTSGGGYQGGGGGGGGAYVNVGAISVVPGETYTVVVGAGGAGGAGGSHAVAPPGYGDNGGDSSFSGSDIGPYLANGGGGGGGGPGSSGGIGGGNGGNGGMDGVLGTGGVSGGGGGGGAGSACGAGGNGGDASDPTGGAGGSADMDSGAGGNGGNAGSPGSDGQSLGGGGGGGGANRNGQGGNGGKGCDGLVLIAWVAANNNDTLIWNPCISSTDASLPSNWYDKTLGIQGIQAPHSTTPVEFNTSPAYDPIVNNSPIVWGQNISVPSIHLSGYTGLMTIKDGLKVEDTGDFFDTTDSWLKVEFGSNSVFQLDGGGSIANMTLSGNPSGEFYLAGGTTGLGTAPYQYNIGVNIDIAGGATLTDYGETPLMFTNTNLTISVLGTMNVRYGTGGGANVLDATGFANDYINVTDGGTLKYLGSGNVTDTFKNVPVLVQDGDFIVTTAPGAPNSGRLIVTGTVPNQANSASVYVTGDGTSTVQLSNGDPTSRLITTAGTTLECDNGYYQDSGTLETTDATTCSLQTSPDAINKGTATIAGGTVLVDNMANTYGTLNVYAATLIFGGNLNVSILGYDPTTGNAQQDILNVNGNFNLNPQAGTSLSVNVNGKVVNGDLWSIIQSSNITSSNQNVNFASITTNPQTNLNGGANPPMKQGQYVLSF